MCCKYAKKREESLVCEYQNSSHACAHTHTHTHTHSSVPGHLNGPCHSSGMFSTQPIQGNTGTDCSCSPCVCVCVCVCVCARVCVRVCATHRERESEYV